MNSTPFRGRYAVLHHANISEPHYDLLFDTGPGSDLATWRLPTWPIEVPMTATRLRDHRRLYLDFEGEIGSLRGRVDRLAGGACESRLGPGGHWTVRLIDGGVPVTIELRPTSDPAIWDVDTAPVDARP